MASLSVEVNYGRRILWYKYDRWGKDTALQVTLMLLKLRIAEAETVLKQS